MPWSKETAPKALPGERRPYQRHQGNIWWDRGRALVRVSVPKELRKRYPRNTVARYLGTSDAKEAKELAPAAVAAIRAEFVAMRREQSLTADVAQRIQAWETWRTHAAMVADPLAAKRPAEIVEFDKIESEARDALAKLGLDPSPRNISAAMDALYAGKIGATVLWDRGISPPEPPPLRSTVTPLAAGNGKTVTAAAEEYAADPTERVKAKTRAQTQQTARLFQSFVGDGMAASAVTREHAAEFKQRLMAINPDYRRAIRGDVAFSFAELEQRFPALDGKGMSRATINKHLSNLRSLFTWLTNGHGLPRQHENPFGGIAIKRSDEDEETQYEAMPDAALKKLLGGLALPSSPTKDFTGSLGWIVAVAAFSGLRQGEVLALRSEDFQTKDGVPFIVVRRGKTKNARRSVPMHDALVNAGLPEYAAKCDGFLFHAPNFASRFTDYRVSRGVGTGDDDRIVFHSLRKSFNTKLAHAAPPVPVGIRASLLGHAGGEIPFTDKHYLPKGHAPKQLREYVNAVSYRGVKLSEKES